MSPPGTGRASGVGCLSGSSWGETAGDQDLKGGSLDSPSFKDTKLGFGHHKTVPTRSSNYVYSVLYNDSPRCSGSDLGNTVPPTPTPPSSSQTAIHRLGPVWCLGGGPGVRTRLDPSRRARKEPTCLGDGRWTHTPT